MTEKKPKRPRDVSQLAKMMIDEASGETEKSQLLKVKKGRAGGLVGGVKRSLNLSPSLRTEIAKKAAATRWKKDRPARVKKEPA